MRCGMCTCNCDSARYLLYACSCSCSCERYPHTEKIDRSFCFTELSWVTQIEICVDLFTWLAEKTDRDRERGALKCRQVCKCIVERRCFGCGEETAV